MCVGMTITSSCATDPIPVPQSELYAREFIKNFGIVDPTQNWNNSTRGTVNVKLSSPQGVKVTTKIGTNHYLLADYSDVNGFKCLEFDMPRGVKNITVISGEKSVNTTVDGNVDFTSMSRALFPGVTTSPNGDITISMAHKEKSHIFYY